MIGECQPEGGGGKEEEKEYPQALSAVFFSSPTINFSLLREALLLVSVVGDRQALQPDAWVQNQPHRFCLEEGDRKRTSLREELGRLRELMQVQALGVQH